MTTIGISTGPATTYYDYTTLDTFNSFNMSILPLTLHCILVDYLINVHMITYSPEAMPKYLLGYKVRKIVFSRRAEQYSFYKLSLFTMNKIYSF